MSLPRNPAFPAGVTDITVVLVHGGPAAHLPRPGQQEEVAEPATRATR